MATLEGIFAGDLNLFHIGVAPVANFESNMLHFSVTLLADSELKDRARVAAPPLEDDEKESENGGL